MGAAGKWPDDVEAFQKMKAALGVQLADQIFLSYGTRTRASEEHVDVFMDGFVFRLHIFSERSTSSSERTAGLFLVLKAAT